MLVTVRNEREDMGDPVTHTFPRLFDPYIFVPGVPCFVRLLCVSTKVFKFSAFLSCFWG